MHRHEEMLHDREYGGITKKKQIHVVVVGAKLGGLVAVIRIARASHHVTILKQAHVRSEVRKLPTGRMLIAHNIKFPFPKFR